MSETQYNSNDDDQGQLNTEISSQLPPSDENVLHKALGLIFSFLRKVVTFKCILISLTNRSLNLSQENVVHSPFFKCC